MRNYLIDKVFEKGLHHDHEKVKKLFQKSEWDFVNKEFPFVSMAMEIRRLRFNTKTSQVELARRMKVKREFISRIEGGKQNMTLITIIKIAQAIGKEFKFSFE